jgi:hypothetical protein
VATGHVEQVCLPRHRQEFLTFLRQVAKAYPRRKLRLAVDNYARATGRRSNPPGTIPTKTDTDPSSITTRQPAKDPG